jgi:hypothetical protein
MSQQKYPNYVPSRSAGSVDLIAEFCRDAPMTADVSTTPGVGKSCAEALRGYGIDTVAQLVGRFLMCVDGESSSTEVCQAFFNKLKDMVRGTSASRANAHTIVFAVTNMLAEKEMFECLVESDVELQDDEEDDE